MVTYRQDLPPKGGFDPIEFAARGPKRMFNGIFFFFFVMIKKHDYFF